MKYTLFLLAMTVTSCAVANPYCKDSLCNRAPLTGSAFIHRVLLIGDSGKLYLERKGIISSRKHLIRSIEQTLGVAPKDTTIVFLGDIIYHYGMPDKDDTTTEKKGGCTAWKCARGQIDAEIDLIKNTDVTGVFIPGNHDWNHGGKGGWNRIKNLGKYISEAGIEKEVNISFLPGRGCPGPTKVLLGKQSNKILLVVLDTHWFWHKYEKPNKNNPSGCNPATVISDNYNSGLTTIIFPD